MTDQFEVTINIRRASEIMPRGYEIFLYNRDTKKEEPLRLTIHEVELGKLAKAIEELIASPSLTVTGVEGVFLQGKCEKSG